jgi:hypothetical protein
MRYQAHPGDSHHPERSLAATEQPAEVVPRIVLHQTAHVRDGLARPEYRFVPHELCPRGAMAEHLQPAGVGGDGPPDRRAVTAGEVDPVVPAGRRSGRLDVGDRRASTDRELAAEPVDVGDAGQSAQAEHDLASQGDASADEACVPSLRHEGDPRCLTQGDHRCHLRTITWPDHGARMTSKAPGPVDAVRRRHVGFDDDMRGPDCRAELLQQISGHPPILAPTRGADPRRPTSGISVVDRRTVVPRVRATDRCPRSRDLVGGPRSSDRWTDTFRS